MYTEKELNVANQLLDNFLQAMPEIAINMASEQMAGIEIADDHTYIKESFNGFLESLPVKPDFDLTLPIAIDPVWLYVGDANNDNKVAIALNTDVVGELSVTVYAADYKDQAYFIRQLEYKAAWQGHILQKINPAYTSQRCNACGHAEKDNRLSQSDFNCQSCGHTANADINAAMNIKAAGLAVLACGEGALVSSVKQEPQLTKQLVAA